MTATARTRSPDPYLAEIAAEHPSHSMLAAATGLVYERQVERAVAVLDGAGVARSTAQTLDWGCGKGHITYLLKRHGLAVTSCDVDHDEPDSAFGQPTPILTGQQINVVALRDPVALPFADASFDLVTSFGVLEHVADDLASLREIRRVLRPTGRFFCSFLPYRTSWTQFAARLSGDAYHDRLYTKRRTRELFADAGLVGREIGHEQLLPKNRLPWSQRIDRLDSALCRYTPLRLVATNLVVVGAVQADERRVNVG